MSAKIAMQKRGYLLPLEHDTPRKEMVLLVDDDEDILGLVAEILETLSRHHAADAPNRC
jgi:hypothetical protein